VAHALGIPHYVFNFAAGFREQVVGRFVRAYQEGLTPNPCIDCNRYIKFDQLLRRAEALAFDRVATGHYARTEADGGSGRRLLRKAADSAKDQSYVLYMLSQSQLARIRFPLGEMRKAQVRELAAQAGFINAGKRESQDICFVRDGDYGAFIDRYTGVPAPAGDFVDGAGAPLGEHRGLTRYTVGQRKGLGLALGEPLYVCDKDAGTNTVRLGRESELYNRELLAAGLNLIAVERLERPRRVRAKIRYRQAEQPALAEQLDGDTLRVVFDQPQRAIAKGQAVVLYEDDIVLGGGTIV
jgi:tRNA-specific 2-thiouridylase